MEHWRRGELTSKGFVFYDTDWLAGWTSVICVHKLIHAKQCTNSDFPQTKSNEFLAEKERASQWEPLNYSGASRFVIAFVLIYVCNCWIVLPCFVHSQSSSSRLLFLLLLLFSRSFSLIKLDTTKKVNEMFIQERTEQHWIELTWEKERMEYSLPVIVYPQKSPLKSA